MAKLSNRWHFEDRQLQDFVTAILTLVNGNLEADNLQTNQTTLAELAGFYSATFNATSDWGSASGGYYSITFNHNLSTFNLSHNIWDSTSGVKATNVDQVTLPDQNRITIRTLSDPDLRFSGRIVIIGG